MSREVLDPDSILSVSAAARLIGVSASSLRAWAAEGKVPHERTAGGHRRFRRGDLDSWLIERGAELPEPQTRSPEMIAARADPLPIIADAIIGAVSEIVEAADSPAAPGNRASRRRARRRTRLETSVRALADATRTGDLAGYLREAEWNGFRQGAAGTAEDGPLTDAAAIRWAIGAVVVPGLAARPAAEIRSLHRTLDRVLIRVASGLADGLQAREQVVDVDK